MDAPAAKDKELRMSYRIGRGEQGVLSFEPYKSALLPLWRFKNPTVARESSKSLHEQFLRYNSQDDFVGMDMCRKFIQMGMTRAKRYANHKGGRKYDKVSGKELEKKDHTGRQEKEESSAIFREMWERCKAHEGYTSKKEEFLKEQKGWHKERKTSTRNSKV
ncbi:MAG: hypothetical protein M1820_001206 [Bogoriella megaspora]|nr:MAG: hypothetical protein M1820_001206 [Bogoriella megaspora]